MVIQTQNRKRSNSSEIIPQGGAGVSEGFVSLFCGHRGGREFKFRLVCDVNSQLSVEDRTA